MEWATVYGVARVGHDLATKPPPHISRGCRFLGLWSAIFFNGEKKAIRPILILHTLKAPVR